MKEIFTRKYKLKARSLQEKLFALYLFIAIFIGVIYSMFFCCMFFIACYSMFSNSANQMLAVASLGILQSPLGEREIEPIFGPSGRQFRLNC